MTLIRNSLGDEARAVIGYDGAMMQESPVRQSLVLGLIVSLAVACSSSPDAEVGSPGAPASVGGSCKQDADCKTDFCEGAKCAEPTSGAHGDGRRNAGETGIDCGGAAGPERPCPGGQPCKADGDCASTCSSGVCLAPSAEDKKKNNGESDVDCGGPNAPKCVLGKACATNDDCELLACTGGTCVVPTATDGVQNGSETDVDCGGAGVNAGGVAYLAPRCAIDRKCTTGEDCQAAGCSGAKTCTLPSCGTAETAGIVTCGEKETGEPGAVHDSCCKSLVLPTKTNLRLDKYEITAGRFRTFLTKVGPNIRAWVKAYASANPTSQLAQMITAFPVIADLFPAADRGESLSLTAHMSMDIDNYNGSRGCYNGDGNYAANTYWQDADHLTDYGLPPRSLPREVSDEKSLNCAMPIMYAAFCAWDGGELPKYADILDAWPANQVFPWGNTNHCTEGGGVGVPGNYKPCDAYNWCNGPYENGGFRCQNLSYTDIGEPGVFYEFPRGTDRGKDNSPLLAAPGRFPKDATSLKSGGESWYDLMANLAEWTGDISTNTPPPDAAHLATFCDSSGPPIPGAPTCNRADSGPGTLYSNIPQIGILGSAFEGHQYANATVHAQVKSSLPVTFQYGKFGARCIRPADRY